MAINNYKISQSKAELENRLWSIHNFFHMNIPNRRLLLVGSLAIWSICPIIGILPLLIYCQSNISAKLDGDIRKLRTNFPILFFIVITLSIYMSTMTVFLDTEVYISLYKDLNRKSIFEAIQDFNIDEFLSFVIPSIISNLTQGNELWFLFVQTLTINTAFFMIAVIFLPEAYPIVLAINIISGGYYLQLFLMRQFYASIFIVFAVYVNSLPIRLLSSVLGFLTHRSTILQFLVLICESLYFYIRKLNKNKVVISRFRKSDFFHKIKYLLLLIIIIIILPKLLEFSLTLIGSLTSSENDTYKLNLYQQSDSLENQASPLLYHFIRIIDIIVILFFFIFSRGLEHKNKSFNSWLKIFFLMTILYFAAYVVGTINRIVYFYYFVPGFFYTIVLYSGKLESKPNIYLYVMLSTIIVKFIYFVYVLSRPAITGGYIFWDGNPLGTNCTAYFEYILKLLTSIL